MESVNTRKWLRALLYLGPLFLWMALVIAGATRLGRYEESLAFIQWTAQALSPELPPSQEVWQLYQINTAARELAHVAAFGIFTMLSVRALQWGEARLKWQTLIGTLGFCFIFACSEAYVRFRTPERHVRWEQFAFNALGAFLVFGLTMLYFQLKYCEGKLWEGKTVETDETPNRRI